jgi:hypothetical protein
MRKNIHEPIEKFEEDLLERQELARRIHARLKSADCPVAIGLYGSWGTGKSSLLNLLKQINSEDKEKTIYTGEIIDAWKYEGVDNLFIPIIVNLKKLAGVDFSSLGKQIVRILTVTGLALTHVATEKLGGITPKDISEYDELVAGSGKARLEKMVDDIQETETSFQDIINAARKHTGRDKIVFCIDNLDRCTPEHVVSLLESIKNFVGVENCVWVFAIDAGVIASYIDKKYDGTRMDGNSYLDKIIPEQYHITLAPEKDGKYILDLIFDVTGRYSLDNRNRLPLIPNILVPRRIIKSAKKFAEYIEINSWADRDTIFLLCLLYHAWPTFYEHISMETEVERIFDVFLTSDDSFPLAARFKNDQNLVHFLKTAFSQYPYGTGQSPANIRAILDGLRKVGLP